MNVLIKVRLLTIATAWLATPIVGSRAQEARRLTQPDSVPLDLATALIAAGGLGGEPQVLISAFPGWIANRVYMPSNARVLGSAFLGGTVVGVLSVPDAPETVIADFSRELATRGWKAPPPMPSYGGGFRSALVASPTGTSPARLVLCSDQQTLTASAARRRGTTTEVVIRVTSAGSYSVCSPPPTPTGMARSPFPTLYNPIAASDGRMNGDCTATLGASSGTGTMLRTTMESEALLTHYARQLQDSGWRSAGNRGSIIGRSWTRVDSTGAPLELSLTITTSPRDSACRDLSLQVRTSRKP